MNAPPRSHVQVIIPTYNSADFIVQTLESALHQDVQDLSITVLDNCSTDDTESQLSPYLGSKVNYIRNEVNLGAIGNHNRALDIATGDFIKLLSSDDVLMPGILSKQATALDSMPNVAVVTCNCVVTDEALNPLKTELYLPGLLSGSQAIDRCASRVANLLGAPSNTLLRRSKIGSIRFDPTLKWVADLEFLCQILRDADYFNVDSTGFFYRRHAGADSVLSCSNAVRLHDEFYFAKKYGGGMSARARIVYRLMRERFRRITPSRRDND